MDTPPKARRRLRAKTPDQPCETPESKGTPASSSASTGAKSKAHAEVLADLRAQLQEQALMQRASLAMQPQAMTGPLPCREAEQDAISSHLRWAIRGGGSSKVLYVSGMPGTGKTASVLHAVQQLQEGSKFKFAFVHVNAMCLGNPNAVYGEILRQLKEAGAESGPARRCAAGTAQDKLQAFFERRQSKDLVVVLLIDELDCLVTRNQAVLYRIFNWLTMSNHRTVITAISNTMDLPERLLPRVSSRFGLVRVDFQPYKRDQIVEILQTRLANQNASEAFCQDTLKLSGARVAAGSGDIRKALQLCKRALELCQEQRQSRRVGIEHLREAEKDLLHANPSVLAIHHLGMKSRLYLLAILLEMRKRDAEAVVERKISNRFAKLSEAMWRRDRSEAGNEPSELELFQKRITSLDEAGFLLRSLEAMSLLSIQYRHREGDDEFEANGKAPLVLLQSLDIDDLAGALQEAEKDPALQELITGQVAV